MAEGRLPVAKGLALTDDDRLRGWVIERIMCDDAVHLDAAEGAAPGWWAAERRALDAMARDGLLRRDGARLALTSEGRALSRVVAATFAVYLARSEARHSVAVGCRAVFCRS